MLDGYSSSASSSDEDFSNYHCQSDSSEDCDYYATDYNPSPTADDWFSEHDNPFKMYKDGKEQTSDMYGEIVVSKKEKAKVCYKTFLPYTRFFYKNIKTEGSLVIFLVFYNFKPKNVLNMFLFSKCNDSLTWRISSRNSNCGLLFFVDVKNNVNG